MKSGNEEGINVIMIVVVLLLVGESSLNLDVLNTENVVEDKELTSSAVDGVKEESFYKLCFTS